MELIGEPLTSSPHPRSTWHHTAAVGQGIDATDVIPTEALLDAALDAFAERGYDGTSVREIARDLGVSHNLIPQRIGSKDELWRAAVDHGFGPAARSPAALAAGRRRRPTTSTGCGRSSCGFVEANAARPALLRIINREAVAPGPRFDHLWDALHRSGARLVGADLLGRLDAAGQVRTESVALVYFFMTHGAGGPLGPAGAGRALRRRRRPGDDPDAVRRHAEAAPTCSSTGCVTPTVQY